MVIYSKGQLINSLKSVNPTNIVLTARASTQLNSANAKCSKFQFCLAQLLQALVLLPDVSTKIVKANQVDEIMSTDQTNLIKSN